MIMLPRSVILVLFFGSVLILNVDPVKPEMKNEESLFSELHKITNTAVDLYQLLKKIISHPQNADIVLNDVINWLVGDDTHDTHALDVINAKFTDISSKLNWFMMRMEVKIATIENMISQVALTTEIESIKRKLALAIRNIKNLYDDALKYSSEIAQHDRIYLQDLADTLTERQPAGNLQKSLLKLYNYIVPEIAQNLKEGFLDLLNHHVQAEGDTLCGDQSPNQYLYQLHKLVVTTEMMGQVALTFGHYLQHKLKNASIDFELKQAHEEQLGRLRNYFTTFKSAMENASTSLRPCDPPNLIRGETFIEMEGLYQAVLVEDYNLNYEDSCRGSCDTIDVHPHRNDKDGVLCARLHKCWNLLTSRYCIRPNELRRYEWIEDQNGALYGEKNGCQGQELATPGWRIGFYDCENCICTCEGGHKERMKNEVQALSLRASRSNIAENMVVTKIKFSRIESVICIQIKQGKLLPGGDIDENSEKWTECDFFYPTYTRARNGTSEYVEEKDFVVLNSTYNYIDLDEIVGGKDTTLTGVKFGLSDSCTEGKHVKLQLEFTKFHFSSGVLNASEGTWSSSACHTQQISIADTDSPLNQRNPRDQNTVDSRSDSYVRFGWSIFKKDVGQTTLPLLDAQPVDSKPSAPLSGAGLFYKASPGYGGFLALKIHTINYGEYMEGETKEEATEDTAQDFDQQSEDDNSHTSSAQDDNPHTSSAPYFAFLAVPFFVILCLYLRRKIIASKRISFNVFTDEQENN